MHHSRALLLHLATSFLTGCASGADDGAHDSDELDVAAAEPDVVESADDGFEFRDDGTFDVEGAGDSVAEDSSGGTDGTDAPGPDPITDCPAQAVQFQACEGSFSCKWGQQCCCGTCDDSERCVCEGGQMACIYVDHCLGRVCSPGCDLNEYETPDGCTPVGQIFSVVEGLSADVAAEHAACTEDSDCTSVRVETGCGALCPIAVQASAATDVVSQVTQLAALWCDPVAAAGGPGMAALVCPDTPAGACVEGQCKAVAICDPEYFPLGTVCDDGDACTTNDACSPSGCAGTPHDCDDGDACTVDSCTPEVGCTTTSTDSFCPGASSCSVGGFCDAGQCVDSGLTGWSRYYPMTGDESSTNIVGRAGGGWVIGSRQYVSGGQVAKGLIMGISAGGEVDWKHELVGWVTELVALPSGKISFLQGNELRWVSSDGVLGAAVDFGQQFAYWSPDDMAAVADGGLVMTGRSTSSLDSPVLRVIRFEPDGSIAWNRDYANVNPYGGWSTVAANTLGFLVASASNVPAGEQGTTNDLRLLRLDAEGDVLSDIIVAPASTNDEPNRVIPLADGGLLLASVSADYSKGKEFTSHLRRLDANDAIVWERTWPDIASVLDSYDGGVVMLDGYFGSAPFNVRLVRVDHEGVVSAPVPIPSATFPTSWLQDGDVDADGVTLFGHGQPISLESDLWILRVNAPCFDPPCDVNCP